MNSNWGVLFNPNKDLLKSHSAENRFPLHYYSGNSKASPGDSARCSEVLGRSARAGRRQS